MRININLSEELVKQIDEKAKEMYISRSAYIATALAQKMQTDALSKQLPEFVLLAQQIQQQGLIDNNQLELK